MIMFTFSALHQKYFFGHFGPKNQNCLFKMKLGTDYQCQNIMPKVTPKSWKIGQDQKALTSAFAQYPYQKIIFGRETLR